MQNSADSSGRQAGGAYPHPVIAWYAIFIFYLAYTLAFVDRIIISFLVTPIRADFQITDFQFSLISGLAFAIFYATLGIPIARLADTRNRRNIITVGIGIWSVMTAICGLTSNYWQLFLARLGVGVGEAALSPSAISMIADYFPKEKRTLPINVYAAGVQGGAGLANIFGGLIVGYAMAGGVHDIALLGDLKTWQIAFIAVGLPGLLVSCLMLTVKEPVRQEVRATGQRVTFRETLSYIYRHKTVYATLIVGASFSSMASYGTFNWVPVLFERVYGWGPARIGPSFGLITLSVGTLALVASGLIVNALVRAGRSAPYSWVMIISMTCVILPTGLLVAVDNPYWTLGCLTLMLLFLSAPIGLVQAALAGITPNEIRAQVVAIYLLVVTIFGVSFGPSAVAAVTDYYYHDDAAVGKSMAIVAASACVLGVITLYRGIDAYKRKVNQKDD
ncbi:MAG: MFS transporter [Gammaproteobacteria bacterium]|jgi:MFS family permease|nr:MAG: MFS transporter [Gammaproteobacteria bacterium]